MSRPRKVVPNAFYEITRRCTQRLFLMRPDEATNNAYRYCLILAALAFNIQLIQMCAMSNHHHVIIFDPDGRYPEFIEHMHKLFARSQNRLRRRFENFWNSKKTSVVRLIEGDDLLNKILYVTMNPVEAGLVDRADQWPGVTGVKQLLSTNRTISARRPDHFFRDNSLPLHVSMELTLPGMGNQEEVIETLRRMIERAEAKIRAARFASGLRVVGVRGVKKTPWTTAPATDSDNFFLNPQIAARRKEARLFAIADLKNFCSAYREARKRWLEGVETVFPHGTYWLRRFAHVPVAEELAIAN